jgi:uridine kinase
MGTEPFGLAPIIIVEGLHPIYTERLRSLIDFKIFVDPSMPGQDFGRSEEMWKLVDIILKRF